MGGGEAGDWDAEWGGADVVEADAVAEVDAGRVAAVFAADADFQAGFRAASLFGADADEFAYAVGVDGDEGVEGRMPSSM